MLLSLTYIASERTSLKEKAGVADCRATDVKFDRIASMTNQAGKELIGRGERIRTSGPCLPKTVLYQAELHPEIGG